MSLPAKKNFELPENRMMFETSRYFQPYIFFFNSYRRLPNKITYFSIARKKLFNEIIKKFNPAPSDYIMSEQWNFDGNDYKLNTVFFSVGEGICIYFNPNSGDNSVEILYLPWIEKELLEKTRELVVSCMEKEQENSIYILQRSNGEISISNFSVADKNINPQQIFNDDFLPVNEIIIKRLNEKQGKGLVLLHGKPGTGKTTYIRYLTGKVKKRLIFIPPDLISIISSPDFISLLRAYPNSVLIIEDAESEIEERRSGSNSAVSNLLNLTDGLLSDCLHIQAVCTFNTDFSRIDKALSRKGRLIARYYFDELNKEKAQVLIEACGRNIKIEKRMTLSEIFNHDEMDFTLQEKKIGY